MTFSRSKNLPALAGSGLKAKILTFMSNFNNSTKVQRIIGIMERLRLPARHCYAQALAGGRSSNRLTVNVMRNQHRFASINGI
jgi:hypothetical protein